MSDYAHDSADRSRPLRQPSSTHGMAPATAAHAPPENAKLRQLKADLADSPRVSSLGELAAQLNGPRAARPTTPFAGTPVNDDKELEREADTMGAKAMQMRPMQRHADPSAEPVRQSPAGPAVVQRVIGPEGDGKQVRQISTNLMFTAVRNDGAYDLYTDTSNNAQATVTDDDADYELAEGSSGELESSAANEILLDREIAANEMKIEAKDEMKDETKVRPGSTPARITSSRSP